MKKKRILHIVPTINGGVGKVVEDILIGLSDEYEMSLLVLGSIDRLNIEELKGRKVYINNWGISKKDCMNFLLTFRLYKYIKHNNIDIVHVHLFPALYWVAFASILLRNIKFIYTEHSSRNNRQKWWLRLVEKFVYSRYDKIVAVSNSVSYMLKSWINSNSIVVVYNGYDMNKGNNIDTCNLKKKYPNKRIISMASRFEDGKDFKTLIDAVALLDDSYHLLLIGDGSNYDQVKNYVNTQGLVNKVDLLGYQENILRIFQESDVTVLSSTAEGFGLVILESLSVNTPCIGSNVPGIQDVLEGTDFLFDFGKIESLADRIHYVINNKNKLNYQISMIKNKFDISCTIDGYRNVYID